jgi:diphthine methyl ester synthase
MLYLIGLGLNDEKDITLRGFEVARLCSELYLEAYTSILVNASAVSLLSSSSVDISEPSSRHPSPGLQVLIGEYLSKLEGFFGRAIKIADREMIELHADHCIIEPSFSRDIGILVVGDPLSATTHADLIVRALQKNIPFKVIHNASIINAIGCTGLQLYRFGQIVSIVFFTESWRPDSFYDKIKANRQLGLHTLCLLDIQMTERTTEALLKDLPIYRPPRFMLIPEALDELLEVESRRREDLCGPQTWIVGVARLGSDSQKIVAGRIENLKNISWGDPLHSLVIPGYIHSLEREYLEYYAY